MRIGAHASALQRVRRAPYHEAIDNAAALGFDGVELIAMDQDELADYYTPATIAALREQAEGHGLTISQFAVYSTACEGMASLDAREKAAGIAAFAKGIAIAEKLGCGIVNLVAHWPIGLSCAHPYPPSYIHPIGRGMPGTPSSKVTMRLPEPFDFDAIWDNYVDSLTQVTHIAADHGVKFAIEGHAHVIVSGTDAMLRLFDRLDHPAATVNFDTSWHFIQREYLPMSIHKLGRRISHVHLRDADGMLFYNAPAGQGVVDWHGVLQALKDIGYDGFVSFEYSGFDEFLRVARESKDYIARVLRELN